MRNPRRRLEHLESFMQISQPRWSPEVEAVRARVVARLRRYLGERLGIPNDPAIQASHALLRGDTPAQQQADLETLRRWGETHPERLTPDDGGGARLMQRLDEMTQRMEANRRPPKGSRDD
jgi:hypothetical protein